MREVPRGLAHEGVLAHTIESRDDEGVAVDGRGGAAVGEGEERPVLALLDHVEAGGVCGDLEKPLLDERL